MREISLDLPDQTGKAPRYTFLIYGPMGCISGDAFIQYSVRTPEGEVQNSKGGSLARLFHRFHRLWFPGKGGYQRKQTRDSVFYVPSMNEDGRIFQNRIVDVVDSGERDCVRLRTVGGLELICTPDHPIADESEIGFSAAGSLKAGSTVLAHRNVPWTKQGAEVERVNRPEIYVKHHPVAPTKIVRDPVLGYENTYKRLARARAVFEAHINGLGLEEYVARLNDGRLDGLQFLSADIDVHHLDENPLNDVPSNLIALSHSEHARQHIMLPNGKPRVGSFIAVTDVVCSVEPIGKHHTYDIKMALPPHNFVADGFVVHNSGKTTLAASFPRPLFLSDVTESGYESLRGLDESALFEPNVRPRVLGIEKMNDMALAREMVAPLVASGQVQTIVDDSLTYYADLYLNSIFDMQGANRDNRKAYGELGIHLRDLRVKWQSFQCNIVWLCLVRDPDDDRPMGGPMIPGAESGKFGAGCDYQLFMRHDRFKRGQEFVDNFELHSRNYGKYAARVRRAVGVPELPSPLVNTTYSGILQAMGFDPEATRAALPPYLPPKPLVIATPAPIQPPSQAAPVAAQAPRPAPAPHVPNAAKPLPSNGARPAAVSPAVTRRPASPVGRPNS